MRAHLSLNRGPARKDSECAVTLLELVAVMALIIILGTLLFQASGFARDRTEVALCMGNLRALHAAAAAHLQDHKSWPQQPEFEPDDHQNIAKWWIDVFEPYGLGPGSWHCPTLVRHLITDEEGFIKAPPIHYQPTLFDEIEFTPNRWSKQPWFSEIGDFHKSGNLMIFPDGSIRSAEDFF